MKTNKKLNHQLQRRRISVAGMLCILALCFMIVLPLTSCSQSEDSQSNAGIINTLADMEGKKIGSLVGSVCLEDAQRLAGESGQALGFNSAADLSLALQSNKIDAYVIDGAVTIKQLKEYPNFARIDEEIRPIQYGFIFSKTSSQGDTLRMQMNEYLEKIKEDGTLDALWETWTDPEDSQRAVDYSQITGENGVIDIATSSSVGEPNVFVKDGELAGLDIDLVVHFCAEYGYEPRFSDMDFTGIIAGITTNKYLMGASSLTITEERAESVNFSDPYYDGGTDAIVKAYEVDGSTGFFESIAEGFKRTFIDESRWKLFAEGAVTTLIISLCSLIFGTILGFIVFMICRKGGKIRNKITNACIWIITGMPTVVLLMILFYIVFATLAIGGTAVSIIAFTLIFAAATIGILRTGQEAIDDGQTEAGCALGYTEFQTFTKIVLPQIIKLSLPSYQSEAKQLLKGTSIVGYIAVQDLTKMGDIVRSATYDAIFPLIAVALVYFALEILIKYVIKAVEYFSYEKKHNGTYLAKNLMLTNPQDMANVSEFDQESLEVIKQSIKETFNEWAEKSQNDNKKEIVRFENVSKSYGDTEVLENINLSVYEGDVVSIIGPSGCGKSTLLRCLNFLDPPTSGTIVADGLEITKKDCSTAEIHKRVGTVFQRWNLFEHWTVIENLMRPQMDLLHLSRQEAYNRSIRALVMFGLHDKTASFPKELSGGQQQRVAIIRTILIEPGIVVLDEPTSALDPNMVGEVQSTLSYLSKKGMTMLIVSHDMKFVRGVCNRAVFIYDKKIYEEGPVEQIFDNPRLPHTRAFIEQVKAGMIDITSKKNDVMEMLSVIDSFCIENRLPQVVNKRMKNVFITLGLQIILPHMDGDFKIRAAFVYSEKFDRIRVAFFYDGEAFNPEDAGKTDIWEEAMADTETYDYKEYKELGYTNWACCTLKNGDESSGQPAD